MNEGPNTASIIAGIFLILCGLCLTLLGGGCTVVMFSESMMQGGGMVFVLLALITLGGGVAMIWLGVKVMTGRFQR
jgi:hypothetical protein